MGKSVLAFALVLMLLNPVFAESDFKGLIKVPNPQAVLKQYIAEEANKAVFNVNDDQAIGMACLELCCGELNCSLACSAKGLVFKEVKTCLTSPNKCFGENNEIRKFVENGFKDITQGPGDGNEIVKAREAVLNGGTGEGARLARDPIKRTIEIIQNIFHW